MNQETFEHFAGIKMTYEDRNKTEKGNSTADKTNSLNRVGKTLSISF